MAGEILLSNAYGRAVVDCYGGQVLSYIPAGGEEVLWCTEAEFVRAAKEQGKAVRGGIPICWPWFGPHPEGLGPQHGPARLALWEVVEQGEGFVVLRFVTGGDDAAFAHRAEARLTVRLAAGALELKLVTRNVGKKRFQVTQALHTYLRVGDVGQVVLRGLEGAKNRAGQMAPVPFVFKGEVDEVYAPVERVVVEDGELAVEVVLENTREVVIWNPAADKADMHAGAFKQMVCVEAAQVAEGPWVEPGEEVWMGTRIGVRGM